MPLLRRRPIAPVQTAMLPPRGPPVFQASGQATSRGAETLLEMDGPKVRAMRHEAGMTRRELAEASSVSEGTLKNIESGTTRPRPRTARRRCGL